MTQLFQKILMFSLIPVCTLIAGGIIAIVHKPNGIVRSLILHFAAGVVFSVVAVELLPDIVKTHATPPLIIGFAVGFLLMVGIRKFTEPKEGKMVKSASSKIPLSLLVAIGVDVFIDGLLLGIGFTAGITEGIFLAIALGVELLSLGMATVTELGKNTVSRPKSLGLIASLAAVFFASAVLGATLLHSLSHRASEVLLSFGVSALLFLVTEELLTEAHEEKETVWHTSAFFFGFLLFLVFGMICNTKLII